MHHLARAIASVRVRLVAAAFVAAAALLAFGPDLRLLLEPGPHILAETVHAFNDAGGASRVRVRGFDACENGWCLKPGASGELLDEMPAAAAGPVLALRVWIYHPPGTRNRITVSLDGGQSFRPLAEDADLSGGAYAVASSPPAAPSVLVKVEAANDSRRTVLLLDQLILQTLDRPPVPLRRTRIFGAMFGLGLAVALLCRRPAWALLTALVVLGGAWLRLAPLCDSALMPLDPDAQMFLVYFGRFSLFGPASLYSAAFSEREPLFIAVGHYFLRSVGSSDFHLRLFTFLLSLVLVWFVIRFGRARFGRTGGLAMGALVAASGPLVAESARGLRLELETIVWLSFLWLAFLAPRMQGWQKACALGIAGGLASLARTTYLPVVVALAVVAFAERPKHGFRWMRYAAVAATIAVLLVIPHRYGMYRLHGDPFWDATQYARWNANMEFAGQPGFPTRAQLASNGYLGPPITYGQYMLGMHTVPEIAVGTLHGYASLFANMRASPARFDGWWPAEAANVVVAILSLVGFGLAVLRPRDRWLPLAFVLVEWAPAFLYDRGLVERYRHTYQAYPLFLMAAVLAASAIVARIRQGSRASDVAAEAPADTGYLP